jgi:signal transduction histidine kinase
MENPQTSSIPLNSSHGVEQLLQRMRLPASLTVIGAILFVGIVFSLDCKTPPAVAFSYYYELPVLVVTWFAGRRAGFAFVGLTLLLWTTAEVHDHLYSERTEIVFINLTTRTFALSIAVVLLSSLKNLSTRLSLLVEERTQALRRMAARLEEAEDSERRRLATDLHDGLGQILSLLKFNLSAALSECPAQDPVASRISDAIAMLNDLIQKSRTLTFDLHPAMLDHLGLVPTFRQFGEEFSRRARVEVTINEEGAHPPLDAIVARHLFRSVKELVNNAARHGNARQIVISVHWLPGSLRLVVDDDGRGFDATRVLMSEASKGLGLPSINERFRSLGGSMAIESNDRIGTRVVLDVPLPQTERQK